MGFGRPRISHTFVWKPDSLPSSTLYPPIVDIRVREQVSLLSFGSVCARPLLRGLGFPNTKEKERWEWRASVGWERRFGPREEGHTSAFFIPMLWKFGSGTNVTSFSKHPIFWVLLTRENNTPDLKETKLHAWFRYLNPKSRFVTECFGPWFSWTLN